MAGYRLVDRNTCGHSILATVMVSTVSSQSCCRCSPRPGLMLFAISIGSVSALVTRSSARSPGSSEVDNTDHPADSATRISDEPLILWSRIVAALATPISRSGNLHGSHGLPGAVVVGRGGQTILITAGEWAEPMITSDRRSRMLLSWDIERGEPVVAELVKN
jgi:hypothetical protein